MNSNKIIMYIMVKGKEVPIAYTEINMTAWEEQHAVIWDLGDTIQGQAYIDINDLKVAIVPLRAVTIAKEEKAVFMMN